MNKIVTATITGSAHHKGARDRIAVLQPGERLRLVREPHNKFDRNAVAVYAGSIQLGYLSREMAVPVSILLDFDVPITTSKSGRSWGAIAMRYEEQPYE